MVEAKNGFLSFDETVSELMSGYSTYDFESAHTKCTKESISPRELARRHAEKGEVARTYECLKINGGLEVLDITILREACLNGQKVFWKLSGSLPQSDLAERYRKRAEYLGLLADTFGYLIEANRYAYRGKKA